MKKRKLLEFTKVTSPLLLSILLIVFSFPRELVMQYSMHLIEKMRFIFLIIVWVLLIFISILNLEIAINRENFERLFQLDSLQNVLKAPAGSCVLIVVLVISFILMSLLAIIKFIIRLCKKLI